MADVHAGDICAVPAELNGADLKDCVSSHSLSSNASLPSAQSCRRLRERRAASWAVSFERLLQDPLGVRYFSVSGVGLAVVVAAGLPGQDPRPGLGTRASTPGQWWRGHMRPPSPTAGVSSPVGPWGSARGQRAPEASCTSARPA